MNWMVCPKLIERIAADAKRGVRTSEKAREYVKMTCGCRSCRIYRQTLRKANSK